MDVSLGGIAKKIVGKVTDAVIAGVIKVPKVVEVILRGGRATGLWNRKPGVDEVFHDELNRR